MRHVAFLGSINVGGNRLKMAELKAALEQAGLANVATVTASGNVLFDHDGAADETLAQRIGKVVQDRFGIDCTVVVRTRDELAAAIADNPFAGDGEENLVHTVFLDGPLDRAALAHSQAAMMALNGWHRATGRSMSISSTGWGARNWIRQCARRGSSPSAARPATCVR